jgi:hypothetical protein
LAAHHKQGGERRHEHEGFHGVHIFLSGVCIGMTGGLSSTGYGTKKINR